MTDNQKKLLYFIHDYRVKNFTSPTLREMVKGIDVSDNKSILGIINTLVNNDYLVKQDKKSRSVMLTDKGIKFLGPTPIKSNYDLQPVVFNMCKPFIMDSKTCMSDNGTSDLSVFYSFNFVKEDFIYEFSY